MQDEPLAPAAFDAEALRAAFPAELWRTPRVSVVVPTANVATWVDECLDSLMTQELDDLEVIVVDDRSSDDTVALARAAARRDRRIRVVAGAVAGGGSARNLGVDLARGEYSRSPTATTSCPRAPTARSRRRGTAAGATWSWGAS